MKHFIIFIGILIFSLILTNNAALAGSGQSPAQGQAYYDTATGHKYIRNADDTYSEYSKKGQLLRSDLNPTHPLLISGKYVQEVTPDTYLVYEKLENNTLQRQVLPAGSEHPDGWRCQELLTEIPDIHSDQVEAYSEE